MRGGVRRIGKEERSEAGGEERRGLEIGGEGKGVLVLGLRFGLSFRSN